MTTDLSRTREKQQYRMHGGHAAVKLCHWMQQSLLKDRPCYKQSSTASARTAACR
jgi:tRNA wybutosine-synthesizing protein 1